MANITFVWELGKGYGHVACYLPLIQALQSAGHQVSFCARHLANAHAVLGAQTVPILQSPVQIERHAEFIDEPGNYAGILHNVGFHNVDALRARAKAWRHLFDFLQPDLAIFDHSPTALLAARGLGFKQVVSGSGFLIPPPQTPLPSLRFWQPLPEAMLAQQETEVLARINVVAAEQGAAPLATLASLFARDAEFLLGFQELDHYPSRQQGDYLGIYPAIDFGVAPDWWQVGERKLFAYLEASPQVQPFLQALIASGYHATVYAPTVPDQVKARLQCERINYLVHPADLARVGEFCDLAVTSGNLATTSALLLQGLPVLVLPFNVEKACVGHRVVELGAGLAVGPMQLEALADALLKTATIGSFRDGAARFAAKYRQWSAAQQLASMQTTIEGMLG